MRGNVQRLSCFARALLGGDPLCWGVCPAVAPRCTAPPNGTFRLSPPRRPTHVLIHIGTNDMANDVTGTTTIANIGLMLGALQTAYCADALAAPIVAIVAVPISSSGHYMHVLQRRLMKTDDADRGCIHVHKVDQRYGFDPKQGHDTHDGIHPNSSGAAKVASVFASAIGFNAAQPEYFTAYADGYGDTAPAWYESDAGCNAEQMIRSAAVCAAGWGMAVSDMQVVDLDDWPYGCFHNAALLSSSADCPAGYEPITSEGGCDMAAAMQGSAAVENHWGNAGADEWPGGCFFNNGQAYFNAKLDSAGGNTSDDGPYRLCTLAGLAVGYYFNAATANEDHAQYGGWVAGDVTAKCLASDAYSNGRVGCLQPGDIVDDAEECRRLLGPGASYTEINMDDWPYGCFTNENGDWWNGSQALADHAAWAGGAGWGQNDARAAVCRHPATAVSATQCDEGARLETAYECGLAAGKETSDVLEAGPEWQQGCFENGGALYFSSEADAASPASDSAPDGAHYCYAPHT